MLRPCLGWSQSSSRHRQLPNPNGVPSGGVSAHAHLRTRHPHSDSNLPAVLSVRSRGQPPPWLPVSPATVSLFDSPATRPMPSPQTFPMLFTSTSPATCSTASSLPSRPACSTASTNRQLVRRANFQLFTSTSPATSSVLDSVAAPVPAPPPPCIVSPATVNLFDEIASDPSDAVTANFPLFTSTSPATSSVLDSVAALRRVQRPRHHRVARVASHRELVRRNRQRPVRCRHRKLPTVHVHVACHIQRARQRRSSRRVQRPRHRVARVASHRELVRRNRQRPVRCRHRKLPTVHVHVACHIQRRVQLDSPSDEIASDPSDAAQTCSRPRTASFSVPATTVLPVSPATVNLFDEIASDPSDAVTANFPLFTSTSSPSALTRLNVAFKSRPPSTSSVLDSATTRLPVLRHVQRELVCLDEIASDPSDAVTANHCSSTSPATSSVLDVATPVAFSVHRVARVASHRELVRRNRQRHVRCRHRKLPTVHVHVLPHPACSTASRPVPASPPPVARCSPSMFDEIASDPSNAVTQTCCTTPTSLPRPAVPSVQRVDSVDTAPACSTASQLPSSGCST